MFPFASLIKHPKLLIVLVVLVGVLAVPRWVTSEYAQGRIKTVETIAFPRAAIVFGAGLRRDGSPTSVLRERVTKAVELYLQGKTDMLIMSGQSPEPEAMRDLATQLGVPVESIQLDNAGLRTYDSCYQAVEEFDLREATLVTQAFHLPRALYICNSFGLSVEGVAADRYHYRWPVKWIWNVRETIATVVAMWDVHISQPTPNAVSVPVSELED